MKAILAVIFICSGALAKTNANDQVAELSPAQKTNLLRLCEHSCMAGGRRTLSECRGGCNLMTISMIVKECKQESEEKPNVCTIKMMNAHFNGGDNRTQTAEAGSAGAVN